MSEVPDAGLDRMTRLADELTALVDAAPLPIVTLELDGTVLSWNPAAERVFGWSAAETIGRILPLVQAGAEADFRARLARVAGGERLVDEEVVRRRADGRPIAVAISTALLPATADRPRRLLAIYQDVSDRRRAERLSELERSVLGALATDTPLPDVLAELAAFVEQTKDDQPSIAAAARLSALAVEQHDVRSALAASEARARERLRELEHVYQGAPIGLALMGRDYRFLRVNEMLAEMNGLPATAHIGRSLHEVVPQLGDELAAAYRHVFETGEPLLDVELSGMTSKMPGARRHWQVSFVPVFDDARRVVAASAFVVEMTAHREAEARLRESEERYRLATHAMSGFIYDWDVAAGRVARSGRMHDLLGFAIGDASPDAEWWLSRIHPDDADEMDRRVAAALAQGSGFGLQYRMRHRDGSWIHVWDQGLIVRDADGRAARVVGSCSDVTPLRRAQAALIASSRRYESVVESLDGIIWEADAATPRFTFVSRQAARLLGHPTERWLEPEFWPAHLHPEDRERALRFWADGATDDRNREIEYRFRHADGEYRWVRDIVTVAREADGTRILRGLMLDLTEQKRLEEQLRQSQKMEAVGRLAGGIAHDFNNLLTGILSYSELVLEQLPADDPLREDIHEIRSSGERAANLTRQLLAFSRRQVLQPRPLVLNDIVAGLDRMLRRLLGEDLELRTELADDLWTTLADASQIEQVLMNLAVNARDAMPDGGTITITTSNAAVGAEESKQLAYVGPGEYVRLTMRDTGEGMSAETMARVFEPFFTTKEPGKGTGLGLAMVYGVVKQSGGSVLVASEPGAGSVFTIYLPRAAQGVAQHAAPVPERRAAGGSETILLVEDDAVVRRLAREVLRRHGYLVLEAADAADALAHCGRADTRIDLLLTDVVMPQMSGRELVTRAARTRPELRVLFISGYSPEAIEHHGVLAPGAEFLPKPFTPQTLTTKVRAVLDGVTAAPAAEH